MRTYDASKLVMLVASLKGKELNLIVRMEGAKLDKNTLNPNGRANHFAKQKAMNDMHMLANYATQQALRGEPFVLPYAPLVVTYRRYYNGECRKLDFDNHVACWKSLQDGLTEGLGLGRYVGRKTKAGIKTVWLGKDGLETIKPYFEQHKSLTNYLEIEIEMEPIVELRLSLYQASLLKQGLAFMPSYGNEKEAIQELDRMLSK